ncbi:ankyrin repeat domain-containing protein [Trinickia dinghuensis]|uniref:Ankyrin repeat domain-containing protein n=1 Tax=Trinickia dinghuensis TaxID=2291023 RepID=A0A3D8K385_9BURK|nr:ankyrin repeat domain-containing protein [Trinickia dinghuensis]RDU99314.1 ankyrin repeat domain-containing protein [Trinickia dinghuensis]
MHTAPSLPSVSRRLLRGLALTCAGALASLALTAHASSFDSLIKAVKFDDVDAVQKALSQGTDPNATDPQGMPLIVLAAREKSDKVAKALMDDPKTDIEKTDAAGENAMMLAALNGDTGLVKALIDKGAEVNKKGWAPLHYAAANGHDDIVKLLLDKSAYVDAGSPNGTTPLMMAARGNYLSTVKVLLDAGADPSVKNQIGLTALDFAKHYHAPDVIKAMQDMYARQAATASGAAGASAPAQNGAK